IKKELAKKNIEEAISFAMTLNNLGVLYRKMRKYEEVEKCYRKVIRVLSEFKEKEEVKSHLASVFNNLGSLLVEQGKVAEGIHYLNKAINEYGKYLDLELKMKINLALAKGFEKLKDEKSSLHYFKAGLLSYLLFREYGMQSVNFIHLLEKAEKLADSEELKGDAKLTRLAILKLYYDRKIKELPKVKCGKIGEIILRAEKGKKRDFEVSSDEDRAILYLVTDLSGFGF
ncbi:hypothetical protein DRO30_01705, partial [Candidatus Bathyarchaeota archaeon]